MAQGPTTASELADEIEALAKASDDGSWDDRAKANANLRNKLITNLPTILSALRQVEVMRGALEPFGDVGQWLFARDIPDDTPLFFIEGIGNRRTALTRGDFKAAHTARQALTGEA